MTAKLIKITSLTFIILLLGYGLLCSESPWPMFRHDYKHTGRTDFTGPSVPDTAWTFEANDGIASSPSIGHNGTIYFGAGGYYNGGGDSSLYALNPDGSLKWQFKTGTGVFDAAGVFSSPAVGPDGTIYMGAFDQKVYALEDSGTYARVRWTNTDFSHHVYSSPMISPAGVLYIGCLDFKIAAIDTADGHQLWHHSTGWCVFSSAAFTDDGQMVIGSKDHKLWSYADSVKKKYNWSAAIGTFYDGHLIDASPAIGPDGTIYVGSDPYGAYGFPGESVDTNFWAFNPDGTIKWSFETDDGVESSPAIGADGTIYFGSYDSCLYAVADSGTFCELKWKFKTGGAIDASPTIDADGIIYIGSRDSNMYALYPDGSLRWKFKTGGGIESSATIDDRGYLYFGGFDGRFYALGTGAPDIGMLSVDIPEYIPPGTVWTPSAEVNNFRHGNRSSIVICEIEDSTALVYSDSVAIANIASGQSISVDFEQFTFSGPIGSTYSVHFRTVTEADDNDYNDTLSGNIAIAEDEYMCGDANSDESVDISDAVFIINFVFLQGNPPKPLAAGNVNCQDNVDISDAVYLIAYVFSYGNPPCDVDGDSVPDC